MGDSRFYIQTGLGKTSIHRSKPFCIPLLQSLASIETQVNIHIIGSIELGLLSKDEFFLDIDLSLKFQTVFNKEIILKTHAQGENRLKILESSTIEKLRNFLRTYKYAEILNKTEHLEATLSKSLKEDGIESLKILNFTASRTGLDNYDLDNVIHFKKAKEIVTQIARVQIKDKTFIDKCRKTISHFDIVDE